MREQGKSSIKEEVPPEGGGRKLEEGGDQEEGC